MSTVTGVLIAAMVSSLLTASIMTALQLPGPALALILALTFAGCLWALRRLGTDWRQPRLERHERALVAFVLLVGALRLAPYAWQYAAGALVAPVTWDDNWHFQELASLVNAERFPPRLNYQPKAYFHFYYVPWVPAAAVSSLALLTTGAPLIKLGYALGALALILGFAWALIVIIRHVCPPPARIWALGALVVAGAAIDGLFALRHWAALGRPMHAEWWQVGLLVQNSFSALSSSLIWVPHHLIAAAAMGLALVIATEPITLAPRRHTAPYAVAGLLVATAAFSSVFAFAGGVLALAPLLVELVGTAEGRRRLAWLTAACLLPSLPLAYIYLGADARGGFVIGQAFGAWAGQTGQPLMGVVGVLIALVLMVLEVGWLFVIGRGLDRGEPDGARLRLIAVAAALVLASTAVIGFSGSNNWALRATIVPALLLACYAGRGLATAAQSTGQALLDRTIVVKAGAVALGLAAVAHVNETVLLSVTSARAPAFASENEDCKSMIMAANRERGGASSAPPRLSLCRDAHSAYHLERPFTKPTLSPVDRELMGRGFGFLRPLAVVSAPPGPTP